MSKSIFYSWQSDLQNSTNRSFIESALENAIKIINSNLVIDEPDRESDLSLDKDTKGIPGTPPIADVIFNKISNSAVFVPDLTFVGLSENDRKIPNPNVLIEYGWALANLGYSKIIPIMNSAYGEVSSETLPFDMKHLRHPITYSLRPDESSENKTKIKEKLISQLVDAIKLILEHSPKENAIAPEDHKIIETTYKPSVYLKKNEPLGVISEFRAEEKDLIISDNEHLFIRLIPMQKTPNISNSKTALELINKNHVRPMGDSHQGWSQSRNKYGAFTYSHSDYKALGVTQLFLNNELWGVDTYSIDKKHCMEWAEVDFGYFPSVLLENSFINTLSNYLEFYKNVLNIPLPVKIIVGAIGVEGYRMTPPTNMHFGGYAKFAGRSYIDNIIYEGEITDYESKPSSILRPFFNQVWNECGLDRPVKDQI